MRTARAPNLLFHGTCYIAAKTSLEAGKALAQLPANKARDIVGKDHIDWDFFKNHGPAFPYTGLSSSIVAKPEICLVDYIHTAFGYALWDAQPLSVDIIKFHPSRARNITLSTHNFSNFPEVNRTYQEIAKKYYEKSVEQPRCLPTPGAILVANGPELEESGLLMDRGTSEEFARTQFLAWKFVRGILKVTPGGKDSRSKITSLEIFPGNESLRDDLRAYFEERRYKSLHFIDLPEITG